MRTTEIEKLGLEYAMCVDVVNTMARTWRDSSPEDCQGMAQNLFEAIIFDLDTQRIVGFKFKSWADRFLVVRAAMLENEDAPSTQGMKRQLLHTGFLTTLYASIIQVVEYFISMSNRVHHF